MNASFPTNRKNTEVLFAMESDTEHCPFGIVDPVDESLETITERTGQYPILIYTGVRLSRLELIFGGWGGPDGGFPIVFGGVSYQIRILMNLL